MAAAEGAEGARRALEAAVAWHVARERGVKAGEGVPVARVARSARVCGALAAAGVQQTAHERCAAVEAAATASPRLTVEAGQVRAAVPFAERDLPRAVVSTGSVTGRGGHSGRGRQRPSRGRKGEDAGAPCKYHYAGYCDRKRCPLTHDARFGAAVEAQWLQPEDADCRAELKDAAAALGLGWRVSQPARRVGGTPPSRRAGGEERDRVVYAVLDIEGRDEIIEWPVLLLDGETLSELDGGRFHRWVRPRKLFRNRELNPESTAVDFASECLPAFEAWLRSHGLLQPGAPRLVFVTCGNWDLREQVPKQCAISGVDVPEYLTEWCNLKQAFASKTRRKPSGMKDMLRTLGWLQKGGVVPGTHHIGMSDVENIARILVWLLKKGAEVDVTCSMGSGR